MTWSWVLLTRDQALYCVRVVLASAAAYLMSHGSDVAGAMYAVLAAAMVTGESAGEGIGISRNRMIGSVLGVAIAVPVASMIPPSLETVALTCGITAALSLMIGDIAVARVATTVAVVSVLAHPEDTTHYGVFRITNTLVGVAAAVGVSYLFWPMIGRDAPVRLMRSILNAGSDVLDAIAESPRQDLRLRRQRSLFRALASAPKVRKENEQDPLLRWRSHIQFETMVIVVEIGVRVLTMSGALGRVPPERRNAPWWPDIARSLTTTAAAMRAASISVITRDSTIAQHVLPRDSCAIVQRLFEDGRESSIVDGLLEDFAFLHERLGELHEHILAWPRKQAETRIPA